MIWRRVQQAQSFNLYANSFLSTFKLLLILSIIQAIQRLSDTWRTPIKNAALWAVIGFFDSNKNFFDESDEERRKWTAEALDKQKFTYGQVKPVKVRGIRKIVRFCLMFNFIFFLTLVNILDQEGPISE